jgi:hypothetical protein
MARFCATPGALGTTDGGAPSCATTGTEECVEVHFDFPSSQPFLVKTQEVHLQLRSRPGSRATRGSDEVPVLFHADDHGRRHGGGKNRHATTWKCVLGARQAAEGGSPCAWPRLTGVQPSELSDRSGFSGRPITMASRRVICCLRTLFWTLGPPAVTAHSRCNRKGRERRRTLFSTSLSPGQSQKRKLEMVARPASVAMHGTSSPIPVAARIPRRLGGPRENRSRDRAR